MRITSPDGRDVYDSDQPVHVKGQGEYSRSLRAKDILPATPAITSKRLGPLDAQRATPADAPAPVIGQPLILIATVSFMAGIVAALTAVILVVRLSHY